MKKVVSLSFVAMCFIQFSFSQEYKLYTPKNIQNSYESGTRSPDGNPGENYWQIFSEYDIDVSLDIQNRKLSGKETIHYYNNSPDTLRYLVIKLLQNFHKNGMARDYLLDPEKINDGVKLEEIIVNGTNLDLENRRETYFYGTNLYAIMKHDSQILPNSKTTLSITWHFDVPDLAIRVGAYTDSSYFMGYWFPQMAVYDDIMGWDTEQYTGLQETYNDLANYNVKITTDQSYLVWATGELQNGSEIFSSEIQQRIDQSKKSEEYIQIINNENYSSGNIFKENPKSTWHYQADDVPDFAFAVSNYYLWDATSVEVDKETGRRTWVNTVYPPQANAFKKSIEWAAKSIEYFSSEFPGIPFPYNKHISYNGQGHAAIEFPMIANDCDGEDDEYIAEIVAHEIAHCYVPFTVLTNERLFAWMDEGFVKLLGERFTEIYGTKREDFNKLNTTNIYKRYAGSINDLPLATISSSINPVHNFSLSYAKATVANVYMLEILKEKGIEFPMKEFFDRWTGKHPTPWDFYYTMNEAAGEDLNWYWKAWYFEYGYPDLSIANVNQGNSATIGINNLGNLPVPLVLEITYEDGSIQKIHKSPEIWKNTNTYDLVVNTEQKKIEKVILGEKYIIDIYPANNTWEAGILESHLY
ncbi:MAG: M1 family metallopeptidase [Bacteroidales bacterium]